MEDWANRAIHVTNHSEQRNHAGYSRDRSTLLLADVLKQIAGEESDTSDLHICEDMIFNRMAAIVGWMFRNCWSSRKAANRLFMPGAQAQP
jgi:hypothetical protein